MKANRSARGRDDAVSNVLGGILFLALVFTFLITVQTGFVPVWQEDREARHMATVQAQLGGIKAEADRQAANATAQPVSMPLSLHQSANRFFSETSLPGTVEFSPGDADVALDAPELLIFVQNGQSLAGASEVWTDLAGTGTVSDVSTVEHLRLRLLNPTSADAGDKLVITIQDADGDFAGSLTAYIETDPPDRFINTQVKNADGVTIYDQGTFFHQTGGISYWWIDTLADELHFRDVLGAAQGPLTLTMTESGLQGQFTITYVDATTGASTGTSGKLLTDWSRTLSGGTLRFESSNNRFPDQTYRLQAGALVLEQVDGTAMRIPPLLDVAADATNTRIGLTIASLGGSADAATGSGSVTVVLDGRLPQHVLGTSPMLHVQLNVEDADLWASFLRQRLEAGGLRGADGEYLVTAGSGVVDMTIYGRNADPVSTEHDLTLELHFALVQVHIES